MSTHVKHVHLVFKTHFDFGFTDLAQAVKEQYFNHYIPRVLATSDSLRQQGDERRLIWTTGSWLIYRYLEEATPAERSRMEAAIESGDIVWHGLPFTTHSELIDPSLFRCGLEMSRTLDRRFGKETIAAKMTDVPGHTRGVVPLLAEAGIRFLHLGVNEAATPPEVPPVFVWQDPSGDDVVVMYQHAYGEAILVPGISDALAFGFTHDNLGPQSIEDVGTIFQDTQAAFPGVEVRASTLDAYAQALLPIQESLPIVTEEIGDTWIHGVGTDPKKVSQYRALCRLRSDWLADGSMTGNDEPLTRFSHNLLCVPEHTWGLDEKTHLADYQRYGRDRFRAARSEPAFQKMEASWAEQRAYLDRAVAELGATEFARQARACLQTLEPVRPNTRDYEAVADGLSEFDTAHFSIRVNDRTGAIDSLTSKRSGRVWANQDQVLGWVRYQTFSQADYDRYLDQYLVRTPDWAIPDNAKPGIASEGAQSQWWLPTVAGLYISEDETGSRILLELAMPQRCIEEYGCPRLFTVELSLPTDEPAIYLTLQWFNKQACRLPEALWCSFAPANTNATGWSMEKMGQRLSPLAVVRNGNRKLHAVERGVDYQDGGEEFSIESLDAPLVAPGAPSLLDFNNHQPSLEQGFHFNLYNNIWGTNFPMWYEDDARFQFVLRMT